MVSASSGPSSFLGTPFPKAPCPSVPSGTCLPPPFPPSARIQQGKAPAEPGCRPGVRPGPGGLSGHVSTAVLLGPRIMGRPSNGSSPRSHPFLLSFQSASPAPGLLALRSSAHGQLLATCNDTSLLADTYLRSLYQLECWWP